MLKPGYEPPSRRALSRKLLDDMHHELQGDMAIELKGTIATLVQDGWSNVNKETIIANCLVVDGQPYFFFCQEAMAMAVNKFGCKITSICTDNA